MARKRIKNSERIAQRANARAAQSAEQRTLIQAKRLMSSPDMGAAAALRAVGIHDRSTIRRLHRKLTDQRITLAAKLNKEAKPRNAKALRENKIKGSILSPRAHPPQQLSSGSIEHRTEPIAFRPTQIGDAGASSGNPHTADSAAAKSKADYASGPILPFAIAEPTQLYRIMLMWSPLRMLLWQQALAAETASRFLRAQPHE